MSHEGHFSCIKIERGDLGSGIYMYSIVKEHTLRRLIVN